MTRITFKGNTEFNVLYFSDVHAKTENLRYFKTAVDRFDREHKGKNTLKVSGGDLTMSIGDKVNKFVLSYMNKIGLDVTVMGNHDLEGGDFWAKTVEKVKPKFKFLAANLDFKKRPNKIEENIAKSTIIERNGERVGFIGVAPVDYGADTLFTDYNDYVRVKNFKNTVKAVRKQVSKLEKKGVNKIFLLSHTGKEEETPKEIKKQYYDQFAKIGGIDVIIGGHDHLEYEKWFESGRKDSSGKPEPVVAVSVGRADDKDVKGQNLDTYGILKAVFDDDGILVKEKCDNDVEITKSEKNPASQKIIDMEEKYLQTSKVISSSAKDLTCDNPSIEENPTANLITDAMLWYVNKDIKNKKNKVQIAFVNPGNIRSSIREGEITKGKVMEALPFVSSTLIKTNLTKKLIMKLLNDCAKSTTQEGPRPGLMQIGGMEYTLGKDNKVKEAYLLNEDGSRGERIDDKPDNEPYRVVYDIFMLSGVSGMNTLKKNPKNSSIKYFSANHQDALIEYLETNFKNKPVEVTTGRIIKDA